MKIVENAFQVEQSKVEILDSNVIAVDIETYNHENINSFGKIRLIQIATSDNVFIFDLFSIDFPDFLKDVFKDENIVKIMHHGIFDMSHLVKYFNCSFENTFCTAISSRILSSGLSIKNSLKAACKRFLDIDLDKTEQVSDWGGELTSSQIMYAAEDAKILIPLYEKLNKLLSEKKLIHIGRMEFKIQEISARLKGKGVNIDLKKIENYKKESLAFIPESIDLEEFISSGKKSGINAVDEAVKKLKEISGFREKFYPEFKIKWNRGFVIYQKNYDKNVIKYLNENSKTLYFKNMWLPAVSVSAGDYKSRELLGNNNFFNNKECEKLKAFSLKDYKILDVIKESKEYKNKYPGINKWQEEITNFVVRKAPVRIKTGRIIHTRELGVDTVEIFRIIVESLVSDFIKTLIVLMEKEGGSVISLDNLKYEFNLTFSFNGNIGKIIEKASKFVFSTNLPSHFYNLE